MLCPLPAKKTQAEYLNCGTGEIQSTVHSQGYTGKYALEIDRNDGTGMHVFLEFKSRSWNMYGNSEQIMIRFGNDSEFK